MKKILLLTLCLSFSYLQAQDMQRVRKNLKELCSPALKGRGYVGKGDSLAARWINQAFEEIGLKKFGQNYEQYFSFPINTFPYPIQVKSKGNKWQIGRDFILDSGSPTSSAKADILYLDTLIFDNQQKRERFFKQEFFSKAIVYDSKWEKKFSSLEPQQIQKLFGESSLWISLHNKLTAGVATKQAQKPEIMFLKSSWNFKAKKIDFKIKSKFLEQYQSQNLIAYIEGSNQKDSFVVFTAHYDHLGMMGEACFCGANDNASGVTMLLELANHYVKNPPTYSVAFMAFAGEEAGLLGSQYYTEHPLFPLERIKVLINLDLVGTGDEGITIVNGAVFEKDFELFTKINTEMKLLPKVAKRGKAANSDHYFFTEKGVKSFFIYTMGGIKAYHDIDDKPETLPLTKFSELFKLIINYVANI